MATKMNITCKSDSEDIRIYINGILHLRIPRDKDTKLQAWVEGNSKSYIIEIWSAGHSDWMAYDNKPMWEKILKLLDEAL